MTQSYLHLEDKTRTSPPNRDEFQNHYYSFIIISGFLFDRYVTSQSKVVALDRYFKTKEKKMVEVEIIDESDGHGGDDDWNELMGKDLMMKVCSMST